MDRDRVESLFDLRRNHAIGLVLCDNVCALRFRSWGVFVGRLVALAGTERIDAGNMNHPRADRSSDLGNVASPVDVYRLRNVSLPPTDVNVCGGMNDRPSSTTSGFHLFTLANVAEHDFDVKIFKRVAVTGFTDHDANGASFVQ